MGGTSRWAIFEPESTVASEARQVGAVDNAKVAEALNRDPWYGNTDRIPLGEMVYRLFSPLYIKSFEQFATTRYVDSQAPAPHLSLEYIHNNIHIWAGGFERYMGHTTKYPLLALTLYFGCIIDRLFAVWQALNVDMESNWLDKPDQWLKDPGTWSIKHNAKDKPTTPLAPFHSDTKPTYYTSGTIQDWMKLHYSYPGLQPRLPKYSVDGKFNKEAYFDDIRQRLNDLHPLTRTLPIDMPSLRVDGNDLDYIVNARYKRYALNGIPFTIYFPIGPVGENHTGPSTSAAPTSASSATSATPSTTTLPLPAAQTAAGKQKGRVFDGPDPNHKLARGTHLESQ